MLSSLDTLFTSNLTTYASKTVVWNWYLYSVESIAKTSFNLSAVAHKQFFSGTRMNIPCS